MSNGHKDLIAYILLNYKITLNSYCLNENKLTRF